MPQADEVMTAGSEMSVLVPEFWSATWFDVLLQAIVFQDCVSRDYEGEISQLGDTVHVTQFPEFDDAVEYQEGEAVAADSLTPSQIDLIVNKRVAKDFIITDQARIQGMEAQVKLRDLAFYSILKKMQSIIIDTIVPSASTPDHQIGYDAGSTLALADFLEAKELLDTQDVPEGNRCSVHGAAQWNDLFNITGFVSRDYVPNANSMTTGSIPTPLLGFLPRMTNAAGAVSYYMHRTFMQLAVQKAPMPKAYDLGGQGKRAMRVNMDVLFGLKQFDNKRVVTIS